MPPEPPGDESSERPTSVDENEHRFFMQIALDEAKKCTPSQTAFSVGAVLVDGAVQPNRILATGFSREFEGNTHAEEVCFMKCREQFQSHDNKSECILYTTMEPCSERLSGKKPCVDRIVEFGKVIKVYVGCREPSTFVAENTATVKLAERGIQYLLVDGMGAECKDVATKGHPKSQ